MPPLNQIIEAAEQGDEKSIRALRGEAWLLGFDAEASLSEIISKLRSRNRKSK